MHGTDRIERPDDAMVKYLRAEKYVPACRQKRNRFPYGAARIANIMGFSIEVRNLENDPYFSRFL